MKTGIYVIMDVLSGKKYVGSAATDLRKRWVDHRRLLDQGKHHSSYLQRAWNKYGEGAFRFQVLMFCHPSQCIRFEQLWIDCFRTADPSCGYNMSPTAGSTRGFRHTAKSIEKMQKAHRGHKQSAEWVARRAASIRNRETPRKSPPERSLEHRNNLSASLTGRAFSGEHRKSLSESAKNRYAASRIEFRGELRNLKEVCAEVGARYGTVWARMKRGLSVMEALGMAGGGEGG